MKKITIIGILLALFIAGVVTIYSASNKGMREANKGDAAYIQPAQLSDETNQILSGVGLNPSHVFEFITQTDQPFMTNVWIERYENGVRQEDALHISSGGGQQLEGKAMKKKFIAYLMEMENESDSDERVLSYTVATIDDSGSGRSSGEIPTLKGGTSTAPLSEKRELEMNRPITLITIINDDGNRISHRTSSVAKYDETGEAPSFIEQYDHVLLLRVKLTKEDEVDESYYKRFPLDGEPVPTN